MEQINTESTVNTVPLKPQTCLKVYKEQSPQYLDLIQGYNMRFEANSCEVIFRPNNRNQVMDALTEILHTPKYLYNFSIKGGGHCFEDFVFNGNILAIIDLSLMQQVSYVLHSENMYSVEAGGTNWSLVEQLYRKFGLVIPSGSCYSVGLGGHICGGGYGLLSRQFGLTIDYLCGVDIVCVKRDMQVETRSIRADSMDPSDQDLLWAFKGGGGGNFGIITCYYFHNLPKAPQSAYIETLSIDWMELDHAKFFLILNLYWKLCNNDLPYFSLLRLNHITAGQINFFIQLAFDDNYCIDNINEFKHELEKVVKLSTTVDSKEPTKLDNLAHIITWFEAAEIQKPCDGNQCSKHKSSYMRKPFPQQQSDKLFKFLTMNKCDLTDLARNNPCPNIENYNSFVDDIEKNNIVDLKLSLVQVDSYGGQINTKTIPSDATAISHRDSLMKLQYMTYWEKVPVPKKEGDKYWLAFNQFLEWVHRLWINEMYSEVYSDTGGVPDPYYLASEATADDGATLGIPISSCVNPTQHPPEDRIVDGCYYNYIDVDLIEAIKKKYSIVDDNYAKEAVLRLFFTDNLDRLVRTKRECDPLNIFNHKLSIPTSLVHYRSANLDQ